ncbi:hypothetical protein, partial [Paenibacillus glucanolyticus]|uniref:hypothetical protein n=1 Tax=Paenibacillus glucanolyticus TaxID=59843 RepID=UPI001C3FDDA2
NSGSEVRYSPARSYRVSDRSPNCEQKAIIADLRSDTARYRPTRYGPTRPARPYRNAASGAT